MREVDLTCPWSVEQSREESSSVRLWAVDSCQTWAQGRSLFVTRFDRLYRPLRWARPNKVTTEGWILRPQVQPVGVVRHWITPVASVWVLVGGTQPTVASSIMVCLDGPRSTKRTTESWILHVLRTAHRHRPSLDSSSGVVVHGRWRWSSADWPTGAKRNSGRRHGGLKRRSQPRPTWEEEEQEDDGNCYYYYPSDRARL